MSNPFHDPGAAKLLSKVREDISDLRGDVTKLLTYTTRYTLPKGAREIAGSARQGIAAGGTYAKTRLRSLGSSSAPRQAFGVLAGAAIIGLLAAGLYALAKSECCRSARAREEEEEVEELGI